MSVVAKLHVHATRGARHLFDLDDPHEWEIEELLKSKDVVVLTTDGDTIVEVIGLSPGHNLLVQGADSGPYLI